MDLNQDKVEENKEIEKKELADMKAQSQSQQKP